MKKTRLRNVLCFGEVLWDQLPNSRQIGGAPLNVAYHLSRLGCSGWPVSCVGDDAAGREMLDQLAAQAIATELIGKTADRETGAVTVTLDRGAPQFRIAEDVAWDYIDLPDKLPDRCMPVDAVVYGSLAQRSPHNRTTLYSLFDAASTALRVFDVNLRPPFDASELIWTLAGNAHLIKLNRQEAAALLRQSVPSGDLEASARSLQKRTGCDRICITAGSSGAGLLLLDDWHWVDAVPVKVHDTVGAGDAFLAVLVQGILSSDTTAEAMLDKAASLASFVAGSEGATPRYAVGDLG